ncbi:hypothetical protein BB560_006477 [Smittium megazygosporum]|uniref:RGS domain-containing protein n=1 Tax=Smittium megazygosporum TaxID=133381 RepID=A0A2T9Y5F0_9FUNG|nr:hypothetical protein BB560_006477 [Smittium megazygosporum]
MSTQPLLGGRNPSVVNGSIRDNSIDGGELYSREEHLWNPFVRLDPSIGSRMAFRGVSRPKWKRRFEKLPTLDNVLNLKGLFPLCIYGYKEYLEMFEYGDNDLEFLLNVMFMDRAARMWSLRNGTSMSYFDKMRYGEDHLGEGLNTGKRASAIYKVDGNRSETEEQNQPNNDDSNTDKRIGKGDNKSSGLNQPRCLQHTICKKYIQLNDSAKRNSIYYGNFFNKMMKQDLMDKEKTQTSFNPGTSRSNFFTTQKETNKTSDEENYGLKGFNELYSEYIQKGSIFCVAIPDNVREQIELEKRMAMTPSLRTIQGAREYVYETMRQETYPRFIKEVYLHNIGRQSAYRRLALGLILVISALGTELSLLLYDVSPKEWRIICFLAMFPGCVLLFSFAYRVDVWYAFAGVFRTFYHHDKNRFDTLHGNNAHGNVGSAETGKKKGLFGGIFSRKKKQDSQSSNRNVHRDNEGGGGALRDTERNGVFNGNRVQEKNVLKSHRKIATKILVLSLFVSSIVVFVLYAIPGAQLYR